MIVEFKSTWDCAIVRTIGKIIGCKTKFRSSAQRGGSTCNAWQTLLRLVVESNIFLSSQQNKSVKWLPYTVVHENQNPSTYLIMLLRTRTSACCLFPEKEASVFQKGYQMWRYNFSSSTYSQSKQRLKVNTRTSIWSRKRRARNLASLRKKLDPVEWEFKEKM